MVYRIEFSRLGRPPEDSARRKELIYTAKAAREEMMLRKDGTFTPAALESPVFGGGVNRVRLTPHRESAYTPEQIKAIIKDVPDEARNPGRQNQQVNKVLLLQWERFYTMQYIFSPVIYS